MEHERCNEPDKVEYYSCSDALDEDSLESLVYEAQKEYLSELAKFETDFKPVSPEFVNRPLSAPDDMTIGDIKKLKTEYDEKYTIWAALKSLHFNDFLKKRGIIPIHGDKKLHRVFVDWGHRHGSVLEY
jgi:hypothetical protein